MGRSRDYRGPRHRGAGDDSNSLPDHDAEPSYFSRSPASASNVVDAEVMWFNADKGFGFVKAADGSEAFLHIKTLEAAGSNGVPEGSQMTVRIGDGPKGRQVTEVLQVRAGSGNAPPRDHPARDRPARVVLETGAAEEEGEGSVKWYNADKGFGFIGLDQGKKDVFVHVSTLTRSGLTDLAEGQKVIVRYAQGQKGPEARTVRPA